MGSNLSLEKPQHSQGRQAFRVLRVAMARKTAIDIVKVMVVAGVVGAARAAYLVKKRVWAQREARASERSQPDSVFSASVVRRRLQSVEARQAMLDAFNATPDELGEAAVALASRTGDSRKAR